MKQVNVFAGRALAMLIGSTIACTAAYAQSGTLKAQVIGTWAYVSVNTVRADGSRQPMYGPHPQGLAVFDANGHYILMTLRDDMPKFASGNRMESTPDENKAVVQGMIAHFGTYTVDEADKTITFHIASSSFPNWNGVEQKRPFTVDGDQLEWKTPGSSGGTAEVTLRRLK